MFRQQTKSTGFKKFGRGKGMNSNAGFKFKMTRSNHSRNDAPKRKKRLGEEIDPALFIKKASAVEQKEIEIKHTFADFALCDAIKKNLAYKKFVTPTPIQDQAIPQILEGRDLIGLANTGTGKTAAFLLPLINKAYANRHEKALIIAPTRELALQIEQEFRHFAWDMKLFSASCVGGMPIFKQISNLKRNPNFVIGTPGRLKDLIDRKLILPEQFRSIVLDEVDRMLDMGFVDEIKKILEMLPKERQTLFFSATMPEKIERLAGQFLSDPVTVAVKQGNTSANVDQDVVRYRSSAMKFQELKDLLKQKELTKVLIFIETKAEVERITGDLVTDGFQADCIHGDKKQHQRARALTQFKRNSVNILVATDVAARGLDIDDISHVINYTIPQTYDDYIHRIGRTGRGSNKGMALTFVN
jgi:superfamily II DNA/RNA helicase